MNQTPILISVYNRYSHLLQCIESLKSNKSSKFSTLYVTSDAPSANEDVEAVLKIRNYVGQIEGFKEVILLENKENKGSFNTIFSAINFVLSKHERLIFLEDDNIVSRNFLDYMNVCLTYYQHHTSIFSISGYNYPISLPDNYKYNIYKWPGFSAWGVGLWKKKWVNINWDIDELHKYITIKENIKKINHKSQSSLPILQYIINSKKIIIDAYIGYYLLKNGQFSIYPCISKVRNLGHDGTGEHGGITNIYRNQPIDHDMNFSIYDDPPLNKEIFEILRHHFKLSKKEHFIQYLKKYIMFIF